MDDQLLRRIPKVDELLRDPLLAGCCRTLPQQTVTQAIRQALEELRREILAGTLGALPERPELCRKIADLADRAALPSLRNVINGTGIVLHTNLGRACLSEQAARAAWCAARDYSTLEYDLKTGSRGLRYAHVEGLLCRLTGAESALVVNNNASAVLLLLSALAQGGQVVVSRGELVGIGGSFRVPDIMEACGAILREVGTTNKTHLRDYAAAIGPETRALMKVHTSNYRIVGFTEAPPLSELTALGHSHGLLVVEDLGSGCLVDLASYGLRGEPTVSASVAAGVDVVSFSGDKLLGGPQAGILVGRRELLDRLKSHPLTRAMRVDKMTLAALEATLRSYENGTAEQDIPTLAMLRISPEDLHAKAELLAGMLAQSGVPSHVAAAESQVGGGAVPTQNLPSWAVVLEGDAQRWEAALRTGIRPIIGRIHMDRYLLDVRTIRQEDFSDIVQRAREIMA